MAAHDSNSMHNQPRLCLAMIVRDGGQFLAPLLAAAAPWVDEIVIGDTGSTDQSVRIAEEYGAEVLHLAWRDDFAWARNQVLDNCRADWILVLDADEQLAPADWAALRALADSQEPDLALNIATRNYLSQRHSRRGWQPVPTADPHALTAGAPAEGFVTTTKVRMFPNRPEIRYRGAVHETVETSLYEAGVPVADSPVPVHHFGYLMPRGDKDERYLHLAHLKTTNQPHDAQAWAELAESALAVGDQQQSLVAMERALALEPGHADRHLTCGWLLKEDNQMEAAARHLTAALEAPIASDVIVAEAAHLLAQIDIQQDATRQALNHLQTALQRCPDNGHFQNTLGSLYLLLGRGEAAQRTLQRAAGLLPHQAEPCLNLALLYEYASEPQMAAQWRREAERREREQGLSMMDQMQEAPTTVAG